MQALLTYKYDFNYWGVSIWDGVTGSEASICFLEGLLCLRAPHQALSKKVKVFPGSL